MGDILSYYQDRVANESFLGTAQERRSVIQHLRLIGYTLSTAAPASATLTLSVPATVTDVITIRRGDAFATKGQKDKPSVRFEYTREATPDHQLRRRFPSIRRPTESFSSAFPSKKGGSSKRRSLGHPRERQTNGTR